MDPLSNLLNTKDVNSVVENQHLENVSGKTTPSSQIVTDKTVLEVDKEARDDLKFDKNGNGKEDVTWRRWRRRRER